MTAPLSPSHHYYQNYTVEEFLATMMGFEDTETPACDVAEVEVGEPSK